MAESDTKPQITFELTGPRVGYTGMLGGRYGFKDGKLTVSAEYKDVLKLILCNNYACNIVGEAPIWDTVEGASIKIGIVSKPERVITTIVGEPTASVVIPPVEPPTPEVTKSEPPLLDSGPEKVLAPDSKIKAN